MSPKIVNSAHIEILSHIFYRHPKYVLHMYFSIKWRTEEDYNLGHVWNKLMKKQNIFCLLENSIFSHNLLYH